MLEIAVQLFCGEWAAARVLIDVSNMQTDVNKKEHKADSQHISGLSVRAT